MEAKPSSDIAFTASVKAIQSRRGSREAYARMEARGGFQTKITPDLVAFLAEVDTGYIATANAAGQPYVQHRGVRKASSTRSTRPRWGLRITPAIVSTLRLGIWLRTIKLFYF
jgi:hypothetical protein